MLLPAILSIAIVGVPFLFITLQYLLAKPSNNHQEKKYQKTNNQEEVAENKGEKSLDLESQNQPVKSQGSVINAAQNVTPEQQNQIQENKPDGQNDQGNGKNSKPIIVEDMNAKKYKRWQNIFLVISCIILIQSIIGRIYVKTTKNKIELPQFFILSAINAGCVIILYNCIYSAILTTLLLVFEDQKGLMMAKFVFVFYGLSMTFPVYAGLDDFITLDFITSIIAIIYSVVVQYGLMKIQIIKKWPTYIAFESIQ